MMDDEMLDRFAAGDVEQGAVVELAQEVRRLRAENAALLARAEKAEATREAMRAAVCELSEHLTVAQYDRLCTLTGKNLLAEYASRKCDAAPRAVIRGGL
jgi:hypothetical protein